MSKGVNWHLRKRVLERDQFFCQKCYLEDKTGKLLQINHILPVYLNGRDEIKNLITLCQDCHHYASDKKEFEEYMKEQCTGTMTTLIKAWKKVRKEHLELFE